MSRPRRPIALALVLVALGAAAPARAQEAAPRAAYLGVRLGEETERSEGGARVTEVVDGSPAAAAGIRAGDVIVGFGDAVIRGPVGLAQRIQERKPGEEVPITVLRDGEKLAVGVVLADRAEQFAPLVAPEAGGGAALAPLWDDERWRTREDEVRERLKQLGSRLGEAAPEPEVYLVEPGAPSAEGATPYLLPDLPSLWGKPKLGVQLVETTPELRRHLGGSEQGGVLVSKVLRASPAEQAGIAVGDLIVAVDGSPVATAAELVLALADKSGRTFPIEVVRDRRSVTIEVTIPGEEEPPTGPRA